MAVKVEFSVPVVVSHPDGLSSPPLEVNGKDLSGPINISDVGGLQTALNGKLNDTLASVGSNVIVTGADLNLLTGMNSYGLTGSDFQKLADVNATATEIDYLIGVTSPVQTQINGKVSRSGDTMSGILDLANYPLKLGANNTSVSEDVISGEIVITTDPSLPDVKISSTTVDLGDPTYQRRIRYVLDPINPQDVATKNYVDTQIGSSGAYLPLSGGVMSGDIDMAGNSVVFDSSSPTKITGSSAVIDFKIGTREARMTGSYLDLDFAGVGTMTITGVSDPTLPQDAATKNYVDTGFLSLSGGTLSGNLSMAGNAVNLDSDNNSSIQAVGNDVVQLSIGGSPRMTFSSLTIDHHGGRSVNVSDPIGPQDAATKNYVDTNFMPASGGVMGGGLDMGGYPIFNVASPTAPNQVGDVAYNDGRYLQSSNNLSDITNVSSAISNLGLNPGGSNDIWINSGGDTMTGDLVMYANIQLDDGLISFPSLSFRNDPTTGLSRITGGVSVSVGGSQVVTFNDGNLNVSVEVIATDAIRLPVGDTSQRPSGATGGEIRYNSDIPTVEAYVGGNWVDLAAQPATNATSVSFTPTGGVSSTDVQSAIAEVDNEKVNRAGDTMSGNLDMGNNQILNIAPNLIVGANQIGVGSIDSNLGGNGYHINAASTPSDADPTYSFVGATDFGMWTNGSELRFSVGGAPALSMNTSETDSLGRRIVNVSDPVDPQDAATKNYIDGFQMTRVLGIANGINLMSSGVQLVYTVPVTDNHIVTQILVVSTSYIPGVSPVDPVVTFGNQIGTLAELVDTTTLTWGGSSGAANQVCYVQPKNGAVAPPGGTNIVVNVVTPAGGTFSSLVADIIVVGFSIGP